MAEVFHQQIARCTRDVISHLPRELTKIRELDGPSPFRHLPFILAADKRTLILDLKVALQKLDQLRVLVEAD